MLSYLSYSTKMRYRKKTLQILQKITLEFVKVVLTKKKKSQATIKTAGGKIFTFGSYRLGVYGPGKEGRTHFQNDPMC